jgi:SAM-dependent methyltransferase/uncharacterized protein YbaR (Trm112 family)
LRREFLQALRCPGCGGGFALSRDQGDDARVQEGLLASDCGLHFPVIAGIPRILPADQAHTLADTHRDFFTRHPDLAPPERPDMRSVSVATLRTFGDEWQRFPELFQAHERIFDWYFEGAPVEWKGLRTLDAGCGMGRWLHFARRAGAEIVGMDVSPAIDVAVRRDGDHADFVQADLRWPPFAPSTFDLVYSLGVLHHLEAPVDGVRMLAQLVRPGGQLRLYVYRSLAEEGPARRALLGAVTAARQVTVRLPYPVLHVVSWSVAALATPLFLWPRRALRGFALGDRATRRLPLVQYADVPFRMLVAEQFDRFGAPIEHRHTRVEVQQWMTAVGVDIVDVLPGLGWRVIGRRPGP